MKSIEMAEALSLPAGFVLSERALLDPYVNVFWSQVLFAEGDACWLWQGARDENGYGRISYAGHGPLAHRYAYQVMVAVTDLFVLHNCDTPPCVRPSHLFAGTQLDNMRDCVSKGRLHPGLPPVGSANKWAKLTEADVTEIRRRVGRGDETLAALGRAFNVTKQAIYNIVKGKTWRHHP